MNIHYSKFREWKTCSLVISIKFHWKISGMKRCYILRYLSLWKPPVQLNNCILECESATFSQWWLLLTNTNLRHAYGARMISHFEEYHPENYQLAGRKLMIGETTSGFGDGKLSVHLYEIQKPWFFVNETTALPIPESNKPGWFRSISLSRNSSLPNKGKSKGNCRKP